jgi:recombination DNA repair RAD52 pathway protein
MDKPTQPDRVDSNCLTDLTKRDCVDQGSADIDLVGQIAGANWNEVIGDTKRNSSDDESSAACRTRRNDREYLFCPLKPRTSENLMLDSKGEPITVARILGTKPIRGDLQTRPGPGGKKLLYMSGESVSRSLNDIFGYDGWDLKIIKTEQTVCEKQQSSSTLKWCVAYIAHVRIIHSPSGTIKEDIGAGDSVDKHLPTAIQHAIKASITDATKRAARHFGDKLGNILYQGNFSINSAPRTLGEALQQYDQQRATIWSCTQAPNPSNNTNTSAPNGNLNQCSASIGIVKPQNRFNDQVASYKTNVATTGTRSSTENIAVIHQQNRIDHSRKRPLPVSTPNWTETNDNNAMQSTSYTGIQDNQHLPKKINPYRSATIANSHPSVVSVNSVNNNKNTGIKTFQNKVSGQSYESGDRNSVPAASSLVSFASNTPYTESDEVQSFVDPFDSGWLAELNRPVIGADNTESRLSGLFNRITSKSAEVSTPIIGESGRQPGMNSIGTVGVPTPVTVQRPSLTAITNFPSRVINPYISSKQHQQPSFR